MISKDTCNALYSEKAIYRAPDTTRRIVTHTNQNFWESVTGIFSTKKDTLVQIRPAKTSKKYEILPNLSPKCQELAAFGKLNHLEHKDWTFLEITKHKDIYDLLSKAFETQDLLLLRRRLEMQVVEYDKVIVTYDSLSKAYYAKQHHIEESLKSKAYAAYMKQRDAWYKIQDEAVEKAVVSGNITKENLNYYFFETNKLGWLNCDYFTNDAESVLVDVGVKKRANLDAKIIFKDRMAAMNVNSQNEDVAFMKVPKGRKAWIVLMDFQQNSPRLALQEIETGKPVPVLEFKAMTVAQIRSELGRLNQP
jgi:hypothetical protein